MRTVTCIVRNTVCLDHKWSNITIFFRCGRCSSRFLQPVLSISALYPTLPSSTPLRIRPLCQFPTRAHIHPLACSPTQSPITDPHIYPLAHQLTHQLMISLISPTYLSTHAVVHSLVHSRRHTRSFTYSLAGLQNHSFRVHSDTPSHILG